MQAMPNVVKDRHLKLALHLRDRQLGVQSVCASQDEQLCSADAQELFGHVGEPSYTYRSACPWVRVRKYEPDQYGSVAARSVFHLYLYCPSDVVVRSDGTDIRAESGLFSVFDDKLAAMSKSRI